MAQQSVEMILVRQLASYLFVPVIVVDTTGTAVFYNEPAERILGVRFEKTGRIGPEVTDRLIELSDDPAVGPDDAGRRPLRTALQQRRPVHVRRMDHIIGLGFFGPHCCVPARRAGPSVDRPSIASSARVSEASANSTTTDRASTR